MLQVLLNFIFKLISIICDAITTPIMTLVESLSPDLATFINSVVTFLSQGISYIAFAKECFLAITGLSQSFLTAFISYYIFKALLHSSIQIYRFIIRIYNIVKP